MRGGSAQRAQHVEPERPNGTKVAPSNLRRPSSRRDITERQSARKSKGTNVYRRRRVLAIAVFLLGVLALVLAAFAQTSGARDQALPIDPNNAGPDVVLAEVAGVEISSPIRPEGLT